VSLRAGLTKTDPGAWDAAPSGPVRLPPVANKLAERYGSGDEPRKSARQLAALLHRLRAVQYRWDAVAAFDRLDVAWVLWSGPEPPAEQPDFIASYLDWLDSPFRRVQARRMAIAWAAAFNPELAGIRVVGDWLAAHAAALGAPWTALAETVDIFAASRAPHRLADAFLVSDESSVTFFDRLGLHGRTRNGGLVFEALDVAADRVEPRLREEPRLAARLIALSLQDGGYRPALRARLVPERAGAVRRKLAEALLLPWEHKAPPAEVKALIIDHLLRQEGDCRLPDAGGLWQALHPPAPAICRRWLTEATIGLFFRLLATLTADDPKRWQSEQLFVKAYADDIDHAWLLAGPRAAAMLAETSLGFGRLAGCRADLCALVLRVRGITIVATNDDKSWRAWLPRNELAPPIYGGRSPPIYPAGLSMGADFSPNFSLADDGLWQDRLHDFIDDRVGLQVPRHAYLA
jgi:hypothetical protein